MTRRSLDDAKFEKARESMEAGATGLLHGRNVWQREHDEPPRLGNPLRDILEKYSSGLPGHVASARRS
jgi:class I fructose-bisphosphate aldolase